MNRPTSDSFNRRSKTNAKTAKEVAQPLSFRLTLTEKEQLKKLAGKQSISDYIRERIFDKGFKPSPRANKCNIDDTMHAKLLGALGQSRLSSNLNQLAKAANMGALPVGDDIEAELVQACADIRAMRHDLITALGIKVRG